MKQNSNSNSECLDLFHQKQARKVFWLLSPRWRIWVCYLVNILRTRGLESERSRRTRRLFVSKVSYFFFNFIVSCLIEPPEKISTHCEFWLLQKWFQTIVNWAFRNDFNSLWFWIFIKDFNPLWTWVASESTSTHCKLSLQRHFFNPFWMWKDFNPLWI